MKTLLRKKIGALIGTLSLAIIGYTQTWDTVGGGINNCVNTLAVYNDTLYVGGCFTKIGNLNAKYLAKWDNGFAAENNNLNSYVLSLNGNDSGLYVGGYFWNAGFCPSTSIAQVKSYGLVGMGGGMSGLISGASTSVNAMVSYKGLLYVGGNFVTAGGVKASNIAAWNGKNWTSVANGLNGTVNALAVYNGQLYAGGSFTMSGDSTTVISYVAMYNGRSWIPVGSGMNNNVTSLIVYNGALYASGSFTTADGKIANKIAKWNEVNWTSVGCGVSQGSSINALALYNGDLYVGGAFDSIGGILAYNIAEWDGKKWSGAGSGTTGAVNALCVYNSSLYVGGVFFSAGGLSASRLAKWTDITVTTGIAEESVSSSTNVFPNPNNGSFTVSIQNVSPNMEISIYNMLGEKICHNKVEDTGKTSISLPNSSKGMYLFCVTDDKGEMVSNGKIMVE